MSEVFSLTIQYSPGTETRSSSSAVLRTFGVEEELLLVDAVTFEPLAAAEAAVRMQGQQSPGWAAGPGGSRQGTSARETGHDLTLEVKQEQIEVAGPPQTTFAGQLASIRQGRMLADTAAVKAGARAVALATSPYPVQPHLVPTLRYRRMQERFGLTLQEQLTCGFHVHVAIESRDEGVAVLDRIRVWLPVLLALSSNSPFWNGTDSGYSSYRYQVWGRWPTSGPTDIFGSAEDYERQVRDLLLSGVPLDEGMVYFDARLSRNHPTVEVRVADVCLEAEHAAALAAMVRAMVETASRQWRAGMTPRPATVAQLRLWTWQASRSSVEGQLVSPLSGKPCPAGDVVAELLHLLHPVLTEAGEDAAIERIAADILRSGPGARKQRDLYRQRQSFTDVVRHATEMTHGPQH
jgi:glutamate---cysteine ligase / carboxylate-amine ligase